MKVHELRQILEDFVKKPNKSWGEPVDGNGKPINLNKALSKRNQVNLKQSDISRARLRSGTFTEEQKHEFKRSMEKVGKSEQVIFPGDPDILPSSLPKRRCRQCGKKFRTTLSSQYEEIKCFRCHLEDAYPVYNRYATAFWTRGNWQLQALLDTGRGELTFWWWNKERSKGILRHQGLVSYFNLQGDISEFVLSSAIENKGCCYNIAFNLIKDTVKIESTEAASIDPRAHYHTYTVEAEEEILPTVVNMMPQWMIKAHNSK
ncbi:MAG: hypothetical protein ACLFNN_00410 [Candidatus Paceibacterota bacterium]